MDNGLEKNEQVSPGTDLERQRAIAEKMALLLQAKERGEIERVRFLAGELFRLDAIELRDQIEQALRDARKSKVLLLHEAMERFRSQRELAKEKRVIQQLIQLGENDLEERLGNINRIQKKARQRLLAGGVIAAILTAALLIVWQVARARDINADNIRNHARKGDFSFLFQVISELKDSPEVGHSQLVTLAIQEICRSRSAQVLSELEHVYSSGAGDILQHDILNAYKQFDLTFSDQQKVLDSMVEKYAPGRSRRSDYGILLGMLDESHVPGVVDYFKKRLRVDWQPRMIGVFLDLEEQLFKDRDIPLFSFLTSYFNLLSVRDSLETQIRRIEKEKPVGAENRSQAWLFELQAVVNQISERKAQLASKVGDYLDAPFSAWERIGLQTDDGSEPPFSAGLRAKAKRIEKNAQGRWVAEFDFGIEMVFIPENYFVRGTAENRIDAKNDEVPARQLFLDRFWIGKYEVSVSQFAAVRSVGPKKSNPYPVDQVSWFEVMGFIVRLNELTGLSFRLPLEAEWEYACRAGTQSRHYWGNQPNPEYGWSDEKLHPVGLKIPNGFGLYDMSGNVAEWNLDWYDETYYGLSPDCDPRGPLDGIFKVIRGGSSRDYGSALRSANRSFAEPDRKIKCVGFRLALDNY